MKLHDMRFGEGDFACPHCKAQYDDDGFIDSYMPSTWEGEMNTECTACGKPFSVKWGATLRETFETSTKLIPPPEPPKPIDYSRMRMVLIDSAESFKEAMGLPGTGGVSR